MNQFLSLITIILSFFNVALVFLIIQRFMNSKQLIAWVFIAIGFILESSSYLLLVQNELIVSNNLFLSFIMCLTIGLITYLFLLIKNFYDFNPLIILSLLLMIFVLITYLSTFFYSITQSLSISLSMILIVTSLVITLLFKGGRLFIYWVFMVIASILILINLLINNQLLILIANLLFIVSFLRMY